MGPEEPISDFGTEIPGIDARVRKDGPTLNDDRIRLDLDYPTIGSHLDPELAHCRPARV